MIRSMNCPRVLIINDRPLNMKRPVGITLSNLFFGWPADSIAQIYVDDGNSPDNTVCKRHWALTIEDLRMPFALHRLTTAWIRQRSSARGYDASHYQKRSSSISGQSGNILFRIKTTIRSKLVYCVQCLESYGLSRQLRQWIDDFKPDVIYTILELPQITAFVKKVSKEHGIPVVPHFMDDWIVMSISGEAQKGILARRLQRNALLIMAKAPVKMVIGDRMAEEYRKRYGGTFLPFMNCIEVNSYSQPSSERGSKIVFVYCGGLGLGRTPQLVDIGNILCDLKKLGINAELHVYAGSATKNEERQLSAIDGTCCLGTIPVAEVSKVMSNADCLVHVESFDTAIKEYTKYSLSAKLPEYFRAGRPILGYGPREISSMQYIQKSGAGIIVGEHNKKDLRAMLQRLIMDVDLRLDLGKQAYHTAKERHNSANVRKGFRSAIESAIK